MLVNMSAMKNRQMNSGINRINGTFASVNGAVASFHGMFASKISYSSPTLVSVLAPWYLTSFHKLWIQVMGYKHPWPFYIGFLRHILPWKVIVYKAMG